MTSLLLACALAAAAAEQMPEPIRPFLAAKAKDGSPILSDQDRARLVQMPERTRQLVATAIDNQILGSANHLKILLSLELPTQAMDLLLQDNCILCHSDPGNQKPKALFSPDPAKQGSNLLLDLREFVSDVHFRRGLSCAGCHGGTPQDESPSAGARWRRGTAIGAGSPTSAPAATPTPASCAGSTPRFLPISSPSTARAGTASSSCRRRTRAPRSA